MDRVIYLDNHATTPVDPRVLEAMLPYLREDFGNASSKTHPYGLRANHAVERAREQVAALIGASPREIIFTSGATEADNLAIKGAVLARRKQGDHVVTLSTEHSAVLDSCRHLERWRAQSLGIGAAATYLEVGGDGLIDLAKLQAALTDRTVLVSVMLANNEIGVLQPIEAIGRLCRERGVLFHCDAVQGVGRVAFDVAKARADLVSLSAHKMYGPKGVGALYVRASPEVQLEPILDGGGHERGLRSGTLNVAGIVGFGAAAQLARQTLAEEPSRLLQLRERLRQRLFEALPGISLNGSLQQRVPGNLNVAFSQVDASKLMASLPQVALSSGAACSTESLETSHVLQGIGLGRDAARSSIRFGIGRFNTQDEIDAVADAVIRSVRELRKQNPLWQEP